MSIEMKQDLSKCSICKETLGEYEIHTEYFKLLEGNENIGGLGGFICTKCAVRESGIKKLYHLSNDCNIINEFLPRIPEDRAKDEDDKIPRISLSSTIEGCLTAAPWGGIDLEDLFWEDGSFLIRVYEFDIDDLSLSNLLPPEYLFTKDLVIDSIVTREFWYTNQPIKPSRSYLIEVDNYKINSCDYIRCEDMMAGIYAERDRNRSFNWEDAIDGSFTEVCNVEYHIVPEERGSGVFKLNHKIKGIQNEDFNNIGGNIMDEFPATRTWAKIEERADGNYIIGELDTRGYFGLDKEKIIDFLNGIINKGEIIK